MKKQLLPLFLLFIGALASCSAPSRSGEKAAQQLVDYFIYQEKPATFSQTFREPKSVISTSSHERIEWASDNHFSD